MIMNVKKIALGAAVVFFTNFAFAQSLQDGINSIDSDKFAAAKTNFSAMIAKEPTAENYFYLGNTFFPHNYYVHQTKVAYFSKASSLS